MYKKQDAVMTRGFAILCMVILHLFCRTGGDVFGTPLLWLDQETPFVYWFGFYAEICVSVYAICMGYAQYLLYENGKWSWRSTGNRILKLMVNYWVLLVLFSVVGLFCPWQQAIPGSLSRFLKSIVLLHSYNGAWWYLNTYLIFLMIPPAVRFFPVKKMSARAGLVLCLALEVGCYLLGRLGFWQRIPNEVPVISFVGKEVRNLVGVLPAAWAGAFLCKGQVLDKTFVWLQTTVPNRNVRKALLAGIWIVLFVSMNLLHKAVLTLFFALVSFPLFNLWEKGAGIRKIWLFLGKHSTNIWLTHMFFYAAPFTGLAQKAQYPLLMLGFLLLLCIAVSYVEMFIEGMIRKSMRRLSKTES